MKQVVDEEFLQEIELLQLLLKNNVAGMFGGTHKSGALGSSCEFADTREYVRGDDVSKIDWNAFSRFKKLFVKLFYDERQVHTRIYIDASRSMGYGKGEKGEQALKLAAAIAYISVCEMDRVSVFLIREKETECIINEILGEQSYLNSIDSLNGVEFYGDSYISEALLPSAVGYGDGMSVIISDFLTDNDFEAGIDKLVSKRRDVLCLQVLSEEELNVKARGKMHFYDSENSSRFYRKNINRDIVEAYKRALEYATGRVKDMCLSRGAGYALVSASEKLADVFFGKLQLAGVLK